MNIRKPAIVNPKATASGKIILFGEHAVVYGRPAIAVPVTDVQAVASIEESAPGSGTIIVARDINRTIHLESASEDEPFALVTRLALEELALGRTPDWQINLWSTVPIASGLGSGAAISTALVRSILASGGAKPEAQVVSDIVYQSERLFHGTPSGIDNTVVAFEQPVWFIQRRSSRDLLHRTSLHCTDFRFRHL